MIKEGFTSQEDFSGERIFEAYKKGKFLGTQEYENMMAKKLLKDQQHFKEVRN
jgi:hypothetical protein